jgi:hypothetical protein
MSLSDLAAAGANFSSVINFSAASGVATIIAAGTTIAVAYPSVKAGAIIHLTKRAAVGAADQALAPFYTVTPGVGFAITVSAPTANALPVAWYVVSTG